MRFYKSKYLCNSSLRLSIPCAIISYGALTDFVGDYSKRDRHKYQDDELKKNDMDLYLESSRTSTTELFCES